MLLRSASLLRFRVAIGKPAGSGRHFPGWGRLPACGAGTVDAPSRAATVRERARTREAARSHGEPAAGGRALCIFAGVALLLFMPAHLACAGRASLVVTSLDYKAIDPPPAYSKIDLDECYWWTDEHEQVWIAMRRRIRSPISSDFDFDFSLSLLLDRLPAGSARNYLVGKEELRGVAEVGPLASTFESSAGILALYRQSGDRLRGSLKLEVLRRTASLLGGRTRATRYLFAGDLLAIHDERRGREIAMEIEGPAEPAPGEDATH